METVVPETIFQSGHPRRRNGNQWE